MDSYSVADAKAHLSELVGRAEAGETIEITKRGKPVARVIPAECPLQPIDVDALRKLTANHKVQTEGAGEFVRRMRDEARY